MYKFDKYSRNFKIDFLRAIAIVSVVICHTFQFDFAAFGVQLFFFISGFLLADFSKTYNKCEFLLHRIFRLFPLAILMTIIFSDRFSGSNWFVANLLLIQTMFPNYESFPGGWSISYEWIFSLLIATRLWDINSKVRKSFFFLCLLFLLFNQVISFSGHGIELNSPIISLFANMTFFVLGILASLKEVPTLNSTLLLFVSFLSFILGAFFAEWQTGFTFTFVTSMSLLIVQTNFSFKFAKFPIIKKVISQTGKHTYGIFCSHFIIMIGLTNLHIGELDIRDFLIHQCGYLGFVFHFLIVFSISYIIGAVSFTLIEKPCLSLSKKILNYFK